MDQCTVDKARDLQHIQREAFDRISKEFVRISHA